MQDALAVSAGSYLRSVAYESASRNEYKGGDLPLRIS